MGDVVQLSAVRRPPPRRLRTEEPFGSATVALFTGVRIERWIEPDEPAPRGRSRKRRAPVRRRDD